MIELVKEKKILYRLIILVLVTIPLFGLLGGTPFLTFNFRELSSFLSGIYFVAISTLLFWIINITLFVLAEKIVFLRRIILRAIFSIVIGMFLSTTIFYFFRVSNPPPMRIEAISGSNGRLVSFTVGNKSETFKISEADSNFVKMEPPGFKMPPRHFFFFRRLYVR